VLALLSLPPQGYDSQLKRGFVFCNSSDGLRLNM
jgi:hypothetical protein